MSKAPEPTDEMIEFVREAIERLVAGSDDFTVDALAVHKTAKFATSWIGDITEVKDNDQSMTTMLEVYSAYYFDLHN